MIKIELTPAGVSVIVETVFTDPKHIQTLIGKLAEAKEQLAENTARNAEEGCKELWE
jgi:hypothetical protein